MTNVELLVKVGDAVLDCLPIVSSITNAAHGFYKLVHEVDALSPVAPGLKTSLKIHSLSKDNIDCVVGFIPIIGNIIKLLELVVRAIYCFEEKPWGFCDTTTDDDLLTAVCRNNKEIVHLCLGNGALDDPNRAHKMLGQAAFSSDNGVFRQVFNHRNDWSGKDLVDALESCWFCTANNALNATDVLDFWINHGKVLDPGDIRSATGIIENFLRGNRLALAGGVIGILPEQVPFRYIKDILLKYSCTEYDFQGRVATAGVLTEEQRNQLIEKSAKPSLTELNDYYRGFGYELTSRWTTVDDTYRTTHFDTFDRLFEKAELTPDQVEKFISLITTSYIECGFVEFFAEKHEGMLTLQSKVGILSKLQPNSFDEVGSLEKKAALFDSLVQRWKGDISEPQAHELYAAIDESGKKNIPLSQLYSQEDLEQFMDPSDLPSVESLATVNKRFKDSLLKAFPQCGAAPEEQAV